MTASAVIASLHRDLPLIAMPLINTYGPTHQSVHGFYSPVRSTNVYRDRYATVSPHSDGCPESTCRAARSSVSVDARHMGTLGCANTPGTSCQKPEVPSWPSDGQRDCATTEAICARLRVLASAISPHCSATQSKRCSRSASSISSMMSAGTCPIRPPTRPTETALTCSA